MLARRNGNEREIGEIIIIIEHIGVVNTFLKSALSIFESEIKNFTLLYFNFAQDETAEGDTESDM